MQAAVASAGRPLRVGVVGVGVMGSNHARVFAGLPGTELVGVADPDRKQAEFVARTLGCAAVADVDKLIERDVDAITIAAPTHLHRRYRADLHRTRHPRHGGKAYRVIGRRRPGDYRRRAPGRRYSDGRPCRAVQSGSRSDQGSHTGEDILSIGITRVGPFPPRMSNVGVVIDLAVHDIDLIRWFTDSDIVDVQPQLSSAVAEREDIALLQFRTASGVSRTSTPTG